MVFPWILDFDKVAYQVYVRMATAIEEWLEGALVTEEPLMNRLVANFTKDPHKCHVGNSKPISLRVDVAILHRKDVKSKDKFGSDIAITIYIEELGLTKTALFQIKISENNNVRLQKGQLGDALKLDQTRRKAFVLAVDKVHRGVRVANTSTLHSQFGISRGSKGFDVSTWMPLGEWVLKWFSCDEGERSDPGPDSVELLLEGFVVDRNNNADTPWGRHVIPKGETKGIIPAKRWLSFLFVDPSSRLLR